jgi:hypothetical protein
MTLSGPRPGDPRSSRGPAPVEAATHEDEVAHAVAELEGLAERPVADHVAVFERMHAALGRALADGALADGAAGSSAPAAAGGAPGRA